MLAAAYAYRHARARRRPPGAARRLPEPLRHPASTAPSASPTRAVTTTSSWSTRAAVLAITGAGIRAADPAARLARPARRARRRGADRQPARRPRRRLRPARLRGRRAPRAARCSPTRRPTRPPTTRSRRSCSTSRCASSDAAPREPRGARAARRSRRSPSLVSPDGDASYLGRGQGQVWVPAIAAGGARRRRARLPARGAPRYLGAARARAAPARAPPRDAPTAASTSSPARAARTTTAGIDPYVHTVAYNGLALLRRSRAARDALRARPGPHAACASRPAARALARRATRTRPASAIVADGRSWMAVHAIRRNTSDLRHDFGAARAQAPRRPPAGATCSPPRPRTEATTETAARRCCADGVAIAPTGPRLRVRPGRVARHRRLPRGAQAGPPRHAHLARSAPRGARLALRGRQARRRASGCSRSRRPAPAAAGGRGLDAAGARWRFDRPIAVRRLPGYNSGPVEQLDALEARRDGAPLGPVPPCRTEARSDKGRPGFSTPRPFPALPMTTKTLHSPNRSRIAVPRSARCSLLVVAVSASPLPPARRRSRSACPTRRSACGRTRASPSSASRRSAC